MRHVNLLKLKNTKELNTSVVHIFIENNENDFANSHGKINQCKIKKPVSHKLETI